ncbi:hypothetical protein CF133_22575, partial [Aeromonas salmonicida]|uniref:FAD-binding oxidoreductase n=1 Tax=Aeromonas salmonicida TaxID=645 RepID=UPI00111AB5E3
MIPRLDYQGSVSPLVLAFLDALRSGGFQGDMDRSYAGRLAMATDNSVYQVTPQAVLFPRDADDISRMLTLAQESRYRELTFSPRGGGTGTNGQSLTAGIIVDLPR